jgi:hypothetical protein
MSASGEDRVSRFERHCAMLLRTYPAAYRAERGEEITGTLLETSPEGREWPLPRDIRGLIVGGLRARAAFNRQLTTAANVRTALLVGVAAYLAYNAAGVIGFYVHEELLNGGRHLRPVAVAWPELLAWALILVAVGLALLTGRRMVVLAGVLPASAALCIAGTWHPYALSETVVPLVSLAALVALSGNREPPSRRWLVPIALLAVMPLGTYFGLLTWPYAFEALQVTIAAAAIVWVVIDARAAFAVSVFVLGLWLPMAVDSLVQGFVPLYLWPYLAITTVIAVPAVWLLRRQSAHPGRPSIS